MVKIAVRRSFPILSRSGLAVALLIILLAPPNAFSRSHPNVNIKAAQCDASYPDFCIPSPPPDLNCAAIGKYNFTVRPPDPHKFDRDQDGIGCERRR